MQEKEDDTIIAKTYSREDYIYLSKLYERAEKYEDMVVFIKRYIELDPKLSHEERNIFSAGYKNLITSRRSSWRIITSMERKEDKKNTKQLECLKEIKENIEKEITEVCKDAQSIADSLLLANEDNVENKVFLLKFKGDYYRYIAEFAKDNELNEAIEQADKAYKEAYDISNKELPISNSTRLGLILNCAVFYYEIKGAKEVACNIAKNAFDESMRVLDELEKTSAKDCLLIIQLLKENYILWQNEMSE